VLRRQIGKHPSRVFTFRGEPIEQVNTKAWTGALKRAGIADFRWQRLEAHLCHLASPGRNTDA